MLTNHAKSMNNVVCELFSEPKIGDGLYCTCTVSNYFLGGNNAIMEIQAKYKRIFAIHY